MSKPVPILVPLLTLILGGCATGTREGPPAPVVSVTPRQFAGAVTEPPGEVQPKAPKPVVPAKPPTRTYAYREPGSEPDPEAATEPTPAGPEAPPAAQAPAPVAQKAPPAPTARPEPQTAPPTTPQATTQTEPRPPAKTAEPAPKVSPPKPETQVASAPPPAVPPAPPAPADKPLTPGLPPAADGLARQAEQQRQQGDYAGAAATLERSLRIAPRDAYLWNRLARVRLEQGLPAQAGQLAARSNDLAGSQGNVKQDNWRIIAESRRRAGDMAGASEAERRAGGG
ncbi:MAG: tetratricopeptide repeat protein [Bdellovibrio bacteriovorus]